MEPLQLNESCEFGKQPRQQNRFFSIHRKSVCLQTDGRTQMVLLIKEK